MHSGGFVRSFDNGRTDKSNLEYGTRTGYEFWMGKDAGDSSPLFNQKVGVGIDVPLSGLVSFQTGLYWASKGASIDVDYVGLIRRMWWICT